MEIRSLTNGFLICLLEAWQERPGMPISFQVKLVDGGRVVQRLTHFSRPGRTIPPVIDFLKMVYRVLKPPHVLVVYGRGWQELLRKTKPEMLRELRILDLYQTALALDQSLRPKSGTGAVAVAYGVPHTADESLFFSDTVENILWAVLARAGQKGMTWDSLLQAAQMSRRKTDFTAYAFDQETLANLPPLPGVYIMKDENGSVLYVGKSANLARRLNEYFRDARALSPKLEAIRSRIHQFEFRLVGSELEALLLENRLITEFHPELNIQREIVEGNSRYPAPMLPVVVVEASSKPKCAELFFIGGGARAIQIRIHPFKPSGKSFESLIQSFCATGQRVKVVRGMTDWGATGFEICRRHFMRSKDRLQWKEVTPAMNTPEGLEILLSIARKIITDPPPPGEYREG
ncbi:MAG: nucleotide excision repair endonuclease [Lentisphaerota bacterium]